MQQVTVGLYSGELRRKNLGRGRVGGEWLEKKIWHAARRSQGPSVAPHQPCFSTHQLNVYFDLIDVNFIFFNNFFLI